MDPFEFFYMFVLCFKKIKKEKEKRKMFVFTRFVAPSTIGMMIKGVIYSEFLSDVLVKVFSLDCI